ncbi:MAG: hypothetical protein MUO53_16130 [Maribacter sp.]|nr:hypothetical protein [Maribacter sp.]
MNTKYSISIFLFFVALLFGGVYGQTTHYVTLHVNTEELQNNQNAAAVSYFTVDEATEVLNNDSPESFTILVNVGDNIVWNGLATAPSGEAVEIKKIKYKRGGRIFSNEDIEGEVSVSALVIRDSGDEGYIYTIQFWLGDSNRVYTIDPVIKTK